MKNLISTLILTVGMLTFNSCQEDDVNTEVPVAVITVEGENITDGRTSQMTAVVSPDNASNKEVEWSVSDESVAKISKAGLLIAESNGEVKVTARATDGSEVFGEKLVQVSGSVDSNVLVASIAVSGSNITDGKAAQYTAQILPENASNKAVAWSVSDENIATIDHTGVLTPVANGQVDVYASALDGSEISGSLTVTISGVLDATDGVVVNNESALLDAIAAAQPGDNIYVQGGTYFFSTPIRLNKDGEDHKRISLLAHPENTERPVFDFSAMAENSSNRGINLSGDYWHVKGIDVYKAGDNGMNISGSNNLIEFCSFYENADTGLQIGNGGSNNTILNCDSYFNADSSIENADGFAAKLDCGDGNKFIGCRAWNNLDDGWDGYLRGSDNITTTYENCWAFRNGYLKNGNPSGGDGNGFKTGGSDDKTLRHHAIMKRCIAAENAVDGFDHNSNRGDITIYNASAHANGRNISFGSGNMANSLTIKNSLSFDGSSADQYQATTTDITNNSWQDGLSATPADFKSVNVDLLLTPRNADGSLPDIDYLQLMEGSDLIDTGVEVGLEFTGTLPDIGAFEFDQ